MVETKVQRLEYDLQLVKNENTALKISLTRTQAEIELRLREVEKKYDERLAALASISRVVEHSDEGTDSDSDETGSHTEEMKIKTKAKEEAEVSIAASNHPKIKVCIYYRNNVISFDLKP